MQKIPKQLRVCYFLLIFCNPFSCRYLLAVSVSSTTDLSKQKKKKKKLQEVPSSSFVLYCIVLYFRRHLELQVEKTRD